jgi:hypothetical protein
MRKATTQATRRPIGGITVTRIIRESHPIETSSHGGSIGNYVDEYLARAASEGAEIQTVELHFEPEQWREIAESIYGGYVETSV